MIFQQYISKAERKIYIQQFFLYFCLVTFVFLFSSCEQDMNIEIKTNDKRLLVDGEFTTDSIIHTIRLNCSGSLITGKPQTVVSGATISITDQSETCYYIENKNIPGLYQTPNKCCGKGGHTYTLTISNIDLDNDGKMETFTAQSMMPVPIQFDSLVSHPGENGDNIAGTIENDVYFKILYNGPDYVFPFLILNSDSLWTVTSSLGSLNFNNDYYKIPKVSNPGTTMNSWGREFIEPRMSTVLTGDTISFVIFNFTTAQFEFLKEFDNSTASTGDNLFTSENIFDQLKIPTNLPTNIEPSDKAAGYFFIYSVSKISKVFDQ